MTNDQIQQIALSNGFKLKQQPEDGSMALNPYVFDFAKALLAMRQPEIDALKAEVARLKAAPTPPAQEDEPVAWMDVHDNWDLYKNKPSQVDVIPLYTRPDNSGLRKAAGELLKQLDWACDIKFSGHENSKAYYKAARELRVSLEGK